MRSDAIESNQLSVRQNPSAGVAPSQQDNPHELPRPGAHMRETMRTSPRMRAQHQRHNQKRLSRVHSVVSHGRVRPVRTRRASTLPMRQRNRDGEMQRERGSTRHKAVSSSMPEEEIVRSTPVRRDVLRRQRSHMHAGVQQTARVRYSPMRGVVSPWHVQTLSSR